ncbi:MAG TPA: FecR domain-containing protein [Elusimicrobiota bacterium]|nr:FecR domain-containing protein [Elusimicrobiota bacterium]HNA60847.1 FecR domain-containing protein [Elusimicrobiota bacterium]HNF58700.1 FecR domain-containing protein [Elusimicrobiota bacterium]HNG45375.1 FecR domain-containing protein [Elusimicrobiota bacterium]HNI57420.1 FecR domain-containing protein [Elusimicrobiota bacterium]
MNHDELKDLIPAFALGTLSAEESAVLKAHLGEDCAECGRALREAHWAVLALAQSAGDETPPPRVKRALMAKISPAARWSWRPVLALAAGALIVVGLFRGFSTSQGRLEVLGSSGEITAEGRSVSTGATINLGETIEATRGKTDFRLASRVVFRLNEGARVVVLRRDGRFVVRLSRGAILSVVKHGTPYAVESPVAVAAVRGTAFYMSVDSPQKTSVCVCEGRVQVHALDKTEEVVATHHTAASWRRDGDAAVKGPPGALDHSDRDVETLRGFLPQ